MSVFSYSHRVTYADCAIGNHIYYGRYLELLEAARGEFFRSQGTTFREWQRRGIAFPVIECRLRYKLPAEYDDLLRIEVRILSAAGARLNFGYSVSKEAGALVLEAETFHACAGIEGKPKRLPIELRTLLKPDRNEP